MIIFLQISTNLFATRRCGGSFGDMGVWEDPDVSICEFDQGTIEICELSAVSIVIVHAYILH